jgi:hypothetical protein
MIANAAASGAARAPRRSGSSRRISTAAVESVAIDSAAPTTHALYVR